MEKYESLKNKMLSSPNSNTLEEILDVLHSEEVCKIFWESDELIFVLLQNLTESFFTLNTESFDEKEIRKIKLCIDILTRIVENTRCVKLFLKMQLDYYIYPFLMATTDEALKMSALQLFLSLLRNTTNTVEPEDNSSNTIDDCSYFIRSPVEDIKKRNSELLPIILKIIDSNNENCQILALETLELILVGNGLDYAVQTLDRFQAIDVVLSSLMKKSVSVKNISFLKLLIKIYTRMCDKNNVRMKLREKCPEGLESKEMTDLCEKHPDLMDIRTRLLHTIFKM